MSDPKQADKRVEPADVAAPKAGSSKVMGIMVAVNSVLLVGVLGLLVMQAMKPAAAVAGDGSEAEPAKPSEAKKEPKGEGKKSEPKKEGKGEGKKEGSGSAGGALGPMVKIPEFVVHLRNPEVDRYARLSFDVEVVAESDKEELVAALPKVRDAVIVYLSDRTVEDLRGSDGLARAKDAVQTRLRELVPDARIRALYISDFVVQ